MISQTILWAFVAALFCDAINLDDLVTSASVLHDDEEVIGLSVPRNGQACVLPREAVHGPAPGTPPVRTIIDQDSPSLAADDPAAVIPALTLPEAAHLPLIHRIFSADLLFIRYRSLLI